MSEQAIGLGDKLHIVTRRFFEKEVRRNFVGEGSGVSGGLHEIRGFAFVFTPGANEFKRRPELRTRVMSLGQAGFIVNKIPTEVVIESLVYRFVAKRLVVTDGGRFSLDINEFGSAA